jgi:hypothetical protein
MILLNAGAPGWSLVAHAGVAGTTAAFTVTPALNTTGANLVVAVSGFYSGASPSAFSDSKGNVWTGVIGPLAGASSCTHVVSFAIAPVVGSGHTFTISGTGSSYAGLVVAAFKNSLTLSLDQVNSNANATQAGAITPSSANQLIVATFAQTVAAVPVTIGSSFIITDNIVAVGATTYGATAAYLFQAAAAAVNPAWSETGPCGLISFKAS